MQGEDGVGLVGGLVGLLASEQEVAEVDARRNIGWLEIDGAHQFGIGGHESALFEVDLGELVVGVGEVMVDLEGVGELDGRLLQLAFALRSVCRCRGISA